MIHQPNCSPLINTTDWSWVSRVNENDVCGVHICQWVSEAFNVWGSCQGFGWSVIFVDITPCSCFILSWTVRLHSLQTSLLLLLSVPAFCFPFSYWSFPFELAFPVLLNLSKLKATVQGPVIFSSHKLNHLHLFCESLILSGMIMHFLPHKN